MHGDFSLNPRKYGDRVSRVLYQMGRVQLDSDANEQTESTLRYLRALASDVIGAHGGVGNSFEIITGDVATKPLEFRVRWGHYYVDGILCENLPARFEWWELVSESAETRKALGDGLPIMSHADSHWDPERKAGAEGARGKELIYLAAWERHISAAEDDSVREVALGGPDTASRAVVVWQIRTIPLQAIDELADTFGKTEPFERRYLALNRLLRPRGRLSAKAVENEKTDPCVIAPESRYRGEENRLYRVEIHAPADAAANTPASFKWSPDNASIVYPIRTIAGNVVQLESLGRDERTAITKNDWVEVIDDDVTLQRTVNPLLQVVGVDRQRRTVELSGEPKAGKDPAKRPILRRWAEAPRSIDTPTGDSKTTWKDLSDGVEVQFSFETPETRGPRWRPGDYWLIPARPATGDVIWPGPRDNPDAILPHGIDEHYAPLATFNPAAEPNKRFVDARAHFNPIAVP